MKRIVSYILMIFGLMMPVMAKAASASVSISCPATAILSSTVECQVSVNSDVSVNGVVANYSLKGASYVGFTPQSGFSQNYASESGFNVGNVAGKSGSFVIGVLKVKISSAATITLNNIDISDVDFNSYTSSSKSATIALASTNNKLASLSISSGTLSPAFNADIVSYSATVSESSINISASKGDSGQTITGTGTKTLKYGLNTFDIVVKSAAGTIKTYTISITRTDNRSSNNNLSSLSVDVGTIKFNKSTTSYSLTVSSDVTSMKVNATLEDSKSTFASGYGPRTVKLNYGSNSVVIKVNAENGASKSYTIKVNREDNRSSNNNLSSLSLSSGAISFSKDLTEYSTTVPFNVTQLEVNAIAEDSKSKISISNPALIVGDNIVTVTVTSETGKTKVYTITVKRLDESEMPSENNNVSSIDILGHGIDFDPNTNEYEISIGDEYALVIEVLLEDPKAKYVIEGNENLKDGSVIKVTSTSESGSTKEYKINVNKDLKASTRGSANSLLVGIIGFVLGLVVMFITMMIVNKVKIGKNKSKLDENNSKQVAKIDVEPIKLEPVSEAPVIQTPAPVVQASVQEVKTVQVVQQVQPTVVKTEVEPIVKAPVMQEADVKQPISQELNQIPENKTE